MLRLRVLSTINEIDEETWDSIVGKDHLICSYKYLKAVEESRINVCFYRYPLVYEDDKLVAHTCIYKMYFEPDIFARGKLKRFINLVRRIWPNFLKLALLECGTPVALGNTISYAPQADRKKVLKIIVDKMEETAKENMIGIILLRDFSNQELDFYDTLKSYKFRRIKNLPNTMIENKWSGFKEYLDSMRGHYRYKIKKRIKKFEEGELTVEITASFSDIASELLRLWQNVFEHAREYTREQLSEDFFRSMDSYMGTNTKVVLLKKNDKILGFALVLMGAETMKFTFMGLDYEYNEKYCVYFNTFYNVVKLGIESGMKRFDMGITTYIPKMDIGARIFPLYMYMKHRNRFLSFFLTEAVRLMTPVIDFGTRRVFKGQIESG